MRHSNDPIPELSRPIPVVRITASGTQYDVVANEAERAALARRLDLVALPRLEAQAELARKGGGLIELSGTIEARVVQTCVITLEPFETELRESFAQLYGRAPADAALDDPEAPDIEPVVDGVIDLGEAVAQQLSLALDPYPRRPGASLDELQA